MKDFQSDPDCVNDERLPWLIASHYLSVLSATIRCLSSLARVASVKYPFQFSPDISSGCPKIYFVTHYSECDIDWRGWKDRAWPPLQKRIPHVLLSVVCQSEYRILWLGQRYRIWPDVWDEPRRSDDEAHYIASTIWSSVTIAMEE